MMDITYVRAKYRSKEDVVRAREEARLECIIAEIFSLAVEAASDGETKLDITHFVRDEETDYVLTSLKNKGFKIENRYLTANGYHIVKLSGWAE